MSYLILPYLTLWQDPASYTPLEETIQLLSAAKALVGLHGAGCSPVGLFFADAETDRRARQAYREGGGTDAEQADLERWHALERGDPELFGRMHCLYARYEGAPAN